MSATNDRDEDDRLDASGAPAASRLVLEIRGIEKAFHGVPVLRGVDLCAPAGRAVGLVGENGAGKSTLMNIIGGSLSADRGTMRLLGRPFDPRSPRHARSAGVAFIHQELNLFPNLTVAENLFVPDFPRPRGLPWVARRRMRAAARALLDEVHLPVDASAPVASLSAGESQLVEIAKALHADARLVIFDEPTTSLAAREVERLFEIIAKLRRRGLAIVYISHNLEHVRALCEELVILRDGRVVGSGFTSELSTERVVSLMVGRPLSRLYPEREGAPTDVPALEVRGLTEAGVVRDVSFTLHRGEVLGVFGLMGAGRTELARLLYGLDAYSGGEVRVSGSRLRPGSPRESLRRGLAYLTESRRDDGLCMNASIAENITLASLRSRARTPLGLLSLGELRNDVARIRRAVRLTPTARDEQAVKTLSGGNQQKAVLAKWLLVGPRVLILDEPTRGIDVGARYDLYSLILGLAGEGAALLVISSEIEELLGTCDRILVMRSGEIRDELRREEFDRERVLRAALGDGGRAEEDSGGVS